MNWEGDFTAFCNEETTTGAPCDDLDENTIDDKIQEDCTCAGEVVSSTKNLTEEHLSIFPNPTDGLVYFSTKNAQKTTVFDAFGNRLITNFNNGNQLDLSNLPEGVYFLKIKIGDEILVRSVVKN